MPGMAVRTDVGLAGRKMHGLHYAFDNCLPLQDAAIGVEIEPLCLSVEDDPPTRSHFILNFARYSPETLLRRPIFDMAGRVAQTVAIGFCFTERARVEDEPTVHEPE